MERIAIIENNIVSNVITGDENFSNNYEKETVIVTNIECEIGYIYDGTSFNTPVLSQEELKIRAKIWRDNELGGSDFIVPLTDYPNHSAWITYRQELRDWPSTDSFPDTKPTI